MDETGTSGLRVIGGAVLVGLLLAACAGALLWFAGPRGLVGVPRFDSNGAQIYFTGTSQRGTRITADMEPGMGMMMRIIQVPDIRYDTLTSDEHGGHEEEGEEGHPPYTEETIKRAITEGVNPDGEPFDWPMPRWSMSDADLNDMVDFLKSLD